MVSEIQKQKKELRKKFPELNMKRKYFIYDIEKIGYLDIETTNLDANFGFMLSWAMYVRDVQNEKKNYITYDCITEKDIKAAVNRGRIDMDRRILVSLFEELEPIDLAVGHYFHGWRKMDMPYIRTRAISCGLMKLVPKYRQIKFADTWKMAHLLHKLNSYRLDTISHAFGVKVEKTRVDYKSWQLAKFGHKSSLKYVMDHNIKDVKITYEVHKKLEEYMPIPAGYV